MNPRPVINNQNLEITVEHHTDFTLLLNDVFGVADIVPANRPDCLREFKLFMQLPRWATAPASTKLSYHHAYEGGLLVHCCEVWTHALKARQGLAIIPGLDLDGLFLGAFLHDCHKLGDALGNAYYIPNISEKTGKRSQAQPFTKNAQYLATPAGIEEVELGFLIRQGVLQDTLGGLQSLAFLCAVAPVLFSQLTQDEQFAIKHHDGAYGCSKYELAGKEVPLMIVLHMADMLSARLASSKAE